MTVFTVVEQDVVQQSLTFYFDASALVKRYVVEAGTSWVEAICAYEDNYAIAIVHIGLVEVAAAFAAKQRGKFITATEHDRILDNFIYDVQQRYKLVGVEQTTVTMPFNSLVVKNYVAMMPFIWLVR